MRKLTFAISFMLALAAASPAFAYRLTNCSKGIAAPGQTAVKWPTNNVTLQIDDAIGNSSAYQALLNTVITQFNRNQSKLRLAQERNGTSTLVIGNNQNDVFWTTATPLARVETIMDCSGGRANIKEADVWLNQALVAGTNKSAVVGYALTNGKRWFGDTVLHELGHAVGLHHTPDAYSLMGFPMMHANGPTLSPYVGADANLGLRALYGAVIGSTRDISVSHFKFDSAAPVGEYAAHSRVEIRDVPQSRPMPAYPNAPAEATLTYALTKGGRYNVEFTFENMSAVTETFKVRYYLSLNDTITTSDIAIGEVTLTMNAFGQWTYPALLTIPTHVATGRHWWIGAIVDPDNAISEVDEFNATYISVYLNAVVPFAMRALGASNQYVQVTNNTAWAPLRAAATQIGPWERFEAVYSFEDDSWSIFSRETRRFATAQNAGTGTLVASSPVIDGWEKFRLVDFGGGVFAWQSRVSGNFVTSVNGADLAASSPVLGLAQRFSIEPIAP